jgi:hypothetical protein
MMVYREPRGTAKREIPMTKLPVGTKVRYREVDQFGRRTRKRRPERPVGEVVGERDDRGAFVRWKDGFVGSVLWDWIEPVAGQRSGSAGQEG